MLVIVENLGLIDESIDYEDDYEDEDDGRKTSQYFRIGVLSGREFTLHMTGGDPCHYALPVYPVESGFVPKFLLTPLAVAGDVVMVGIVGSVVFVYCAAQEGLSVEVP